MKIAAFLSSRPGFIAFLAGLLLFAAGLSWAWLPLGPIGAGLVLMAVSVFGGNKS